VAAECWLLALDGLAQVFVRVAYSAAADRQAAETSQLSSKKAVVVAAGRVAVVGRRTHRLDECVQIVFRHPLRERSGQEPAHPLSLATGAGDNTIMYGIDELTKIPLRVSTFSRAQYFHPHVQVSLLPIGVRHAGTPRCCQRGRPVSNQPTGTSGQHGVRPRVLLAKPRVAMQDLTFMLPSAVIRSRLQVPQKCSLMEVMKPTRPAAPGSCQCFAVSFGPSETRVISGNSSCTICNISSYCMTCPRSLRQGDRDTGDG
jgi:hypothetical protein